MIYFDNAATTFPKPRAVLNALQNGAVRYGANPGRAGHKMAFATAQQVYHAREIIADFFDLPQCENVIFTKNCTEALNTAIKGLAKRGGHFVCSDLEHNAVVRPLEALRLQGICTWTAAAVGETDEQTVENFQKCLRPNTIAIVCTGASNVFGKTLPLRALASLAHRHGVLLVADTAQSAGILPISMQKDGIDFLCAPGHKGLYGAMGTGVLLCNCETVLNPLTEGGTGVLSAQLTQPETYPERLESGTLNVPGILSVSAGVRFVKERGIDRIYNKEMRYIQRLEAALREMKGVELYTDISERPTGYVPLLSFNVQGLHSEEVAARLSEENIAVRAGLHCAGLAHKRYKTLERGTVRICPSVFTTEKDVNSLLNSIFKIAKSA